VIIGLVVPREIAGILGRSGHGRIQVSTITQILGVISALHLEQLDIRAAPISLFLHTPRILTSLAGRERAVVPSEQPDSRVLCVDGLHAVITPADGRFPLRDAVRFDSGITQAGEEHPVVFKAPGCHIVVVSFSGVGLPHPNGSLNADGCRAHRYLVFPLALEQNNASLRVSGFGLIAFSSVIISVAYTISVVLCLYGRSPFLLGYIYM
jgi:hypothetical protein